VTNSGAGTFTTKAITFGNLVSSTPFANPSSGYWIDGINGNDANAGNTAHAPVQTIAGLQAKSYFGTGTNSMMRIIFAPGTYQAANNSALASAYVPTLVFGIPGDTITAILIGVLLVKGVVPGPALLTEQAPLIFGIYLIFILANLLMVPLGYLAIRGTGQLLRVPAAVLMPIIVAFCVVGSFAINNGQLEILIMLLFGLLGYLMERASFPLAPVVLGLVLGPIVEKNFMQSVIKTNWDLTEFLTRPISAVLLVATVLVLIFPVLRGFLRGGSREDRGTRATT